MPTVSAARGFPWAKIRDGALSHALMSPARHVSKVYEAEVEGVLAPDAADRFAQGLTLGDGTVCRPAKLTVLETRENRARVRIVLREGKYHQVKRMVAVCGGLVVGLRRVQLGGLVLDGALEAGAYRALSEAEVVLLQQQGEPLTEGGKLR